MAASITKVRKINKGDLLLQLDRKKERSLAALKCSMEGVLGEGAEVRTWTEDSLFELRDLDDLTTKEEVAEALKPLLGEESVPITAVKSIRKAYGGTETEAGDYEREDSQQGKRRTWRRKGEAARLRGVLRSVPIEGLPHVGDQPYEKRTRRFAYNRDCRSETLACNKKTTYFQVGESLDQFVQNLNLLAKECEFKAATASQHKDEYVRDAFINGLSSNSIRQRLLENKTLTLKEALNQAQTLEMAHKQSEQYQEKYSVSCMPSNVVSPEENLEITSPVLSAIPRKGGNCFFCGYNRHPRSVCPAKDAESRNCKIKGHYASVCRKKKNSVSSTRGPVAAGIVLATIDGEPLKNLGKAVVIAKIDRQPMQCLIDTGSSNSFINLDIVKHYDLRVYHESGSEIEQLLSDDIIEESNSPWRAQVLVVQNENHKKRLVIDYSQTINKFTLLDAYPLPNMDELVRNVAKYSLFSTIDLKSAYHQVPIADDEKVYTAFEAQGRLYQFKRIPYGVTNGVACFQRVIDKIISDEGLTGVFSYLDDITVCGNDKAEHDNNLQSFMLAVRKYGLELNLEKSKFSMPCINLLGYVISKNLIRPDPDRLKPLLELPLPNDASSLKRALGLFAHYSKWVPCFSEKISSMTGSVTFPLGPQAAEDFARLKKEIANSLVTTISGNSPLIVESDASDVAIAATLSQEGRPVAFFFPYFVKM
ncbi:uncharacterized protein [Halyomorpha halys]|uniref:uncharacterized protein n=1 Tax=Halyomorpha halys TaxID=286706 RepID=UPI0034D3343B